MAKKKKKKVKKQPKQREDMKYNSLTMRIAFTDGGLETLTFYGIDQCFDHIKDRVKGDYVDSVRVELF